MKFQPSTRIRVLPVLAAIAALYGVTGLPAHASSHREAPSITATPKVDGTDFYMFTSYETGRSALHDADRRLPASARPGRRP